MLKQKKSIQNKIDYEPKNIYDLRQAKSFTPSHYDDLRFSKNKLQAWFHQRRYNLTRLLVEKYYRKGNIIVDFGCGNCSWNVGRLPVIGVDYSQEILNYALKGNKINKALCEDIRKKGSLPSATVDIAILNETLEHIVEVNKVLKEIRRTLKPKGLLIISVPYDTPLSLWWPFYRIICFIKGNILGDDLYRTQCGHVNHFSPQKLLTLLKSDGFRLLEYKNFFFLTIFMIVRKV